MIHSDQLLLTLLLTSAAELIRQCDTASTLTGYEADTWGTEFIFAIPPNNNHAANTTAGIHLFTMLEDANCTAQIVYNEVKGADVTVDLIRKNVTLVFVNHIHYELRNVIVDSMKSGLHQMPDIRIHISAISKIAVIAYTIDSTGATDYFTIHPVGMGGDYYTFSLPAANPYGTITLFLLPLGATNATILQENVFHNVTINAIINNNLTTYMERMQAGSLWELTIPGGLAVSFWIRDELDIPDTFTTPEPLRLKSRRRTTARPIVPIARLLIIASIRYLGLDYGCYMPTPMIVDQCALLTIPDYHPTYTKNGRLQMITAPTPKCSPEPILVNTSLTSYKEIKVNWNQTARIIEMENEKNKHSTFIVSSTTTIMNIVRVTSGKGTFIHEIPSYSQWVNGDTVFVVPEGGATVVVIADDYGREVVLEHVEYPLFETIQEVNADIALYMYVKNMKKGIYHLAIDQDLGGRYIVFLYGFNRGYGYGYVPSINLHRISPPIFVQPSTTTGNWTTTEPKTTTTISMTTSVTTLTTTQNAPCSELSTFLYIICIWILFRNE